MLTLVQAEYPILESSPTGVVTVDIVREAGSFGRISVAFETLNASAVAGVDFVPVNTRVTFEEGETQKQVVVAIINTGDLVAEGI